MTVKVAVPAVGVPATVNVPAVESAAGAVRPVVPALNPVTLKVVNGGVQLLTVSVWLYATPAAPAGRADGDMIG